MQRHSSQKLVTVRVIRSIAVVHPSSVGSTPHNLLSTCKDVDVVRTYFKDVKGFKDVCRLPDLQPKSSVRHRKQAAKLGDQFDNN